MKKPQTKQLNLRPLVLALSIAALAPTTASAGDLTISTDVNWWWGDVSSDWFHVH